MAGVLDMTLKGLGELFEGYFVQMCAGKISLVPMGAERRVPRARTRERGPPSALAELSILMDILLCHQFNIFQSRILHMTITVKALKNALNLTSTLASNVNCLIF